jgi:hypothetical protein
MTATKYGQFRKCLRCGEYHWTTEQCKPVYFYQVPEWHGDTEWDQVRANSHEEAAQKAAEKRDQGSGDYPIIHAGGLDEIRILGPDGITRRFRIEAEAIPTYTAKEIT